MFIDVAHPVDKSVRPICCLPVAFEELAKAEHIAPVVAYLCHEDCKDNGTIIEVNEVCIWLGVGLTYDMYNVCSCRFIMSLGHNLVEI